MNAVPAAVTEPVADPDNIFLLDAETTGFMSDEKTVVLEVAAIITDGQLNELATFGPVVMHATEEELSHMGDFVLDMHTTTGLLEKVRASTTTRDETDKMLAEFAAPYFPIKKDILPDGSAYRGMVLGGNSVKFDFDVITKFFPRTLGNMDYRVIDISSVGELARRWNRPAWEAMPPKASDHTAMTDIRAGLDELRYYRSIGFNGVA